MLCAWRARVEAAHARSRFGEKLVCVQRALDLARRLGDDRLEQTMQSELLNCDFYGPTPAVEAIRRADHSQQRFRTGMLSVLAAMQGRFDDAHEFLAAAFEELAERGMTLPQAGHKVFFASVVHALEDDYVRAEQIAREGCQELEQAGADAYLSSTWCMLGQYLYALGRCAEAEDRAEAGRSIGAPNDALTQMLWRQVKAKVLARRGDHAEAVRLAREAIAQSEETEMLDATGDAYADLAEVLRVGGDLAGTVEAMTEALSLYDRKGNLVMAGRIRARLRDLEETTSVRPAPAGWGDSPADGSSSTASRP